MDFWIKLFKENITDPIIRFVFNLFFYENIYNKYLEKNKKLDIYSNNSHIIYLSSPEIDAREETTRILKKWQKIGFNILLIVVALIFSLKFIPDITNGIKFVLSK